jgi:hypothetical protein
VVYLRKGKPSSLSACAHELFLMPCCSCLSCKVCASLGLLYQAAVETSAAASPLVGGSRELPVLCVPHVVCTTLYE